MQPEEHNQPGTWGVVLALTDGLIFKCSLQRTLSPKLENNYFANFCSFVASTMRQKNNAHTFHVRLRTHPEERVPALNLHRDLKKKKKKRGRKPVRGRKILSDRRQDGIVPVFVGN